MKEFWCFVLYSEKAVRNEPRKCEPKSASGKENNSQAINRGGR
jgi:hypothetical protein